MSEETQLLERIDDVQEFLHKAGKYHTSTAHQAYGVLKALSWHPWVEMGEELYFPEGSVLFAEVKPIQANVEKIGWGTTDDYYERRLRDYDNWEVAFWREVIQNSRDSGATRIELECVEDTFADPETKDRVPAMRVSVSDDGRGMGYDTMMTAFFRRGGTLKEAGSVGGFGDAKNLILTPWLGYEVRSHDTVVVGRHEEIYADLTKQGLPYHEGTKVTVWMPMTKTTTPEHAQFLIEQSSLDTIRFSVNGKRVKGTLPKGKLVQENAIYVDGDKVGQLLIHHSPRARRKGVYVRSHGLYMYEMHGYESDFKGVVTIEVNAPPIDVFTTKRDALSYKSSARADVNDVLKRLASDPKQALKTIRDKKQIVFRGSGAIEAMEGRVAEMSAEIARVADLAREQRTKKGTIKVSKKTMKELTEAFGRLSTRLSDETDTGEGPSLDPLPATFGTMMAQTEFVSTDQIAGAIQLSMWKPDFFLYQNISPWTMPKSLHPETMQNKYHVLLSVWTEVCKFLLVQFGMFEPFGVGWVFDSEYDYESGGESVIGAAYQKHQGQHWLLLNPVEIERYGYDEKISFKLTGDRFKLSDPDDIERLVTLAVHEITHMQGISGHTDAYASALTDNMKAVFRIAPVLKKIVKEARASVREVRKATKATKAQKVKAKWERENEYTWVLRRDSDDRYLGFVMQSINREYSAHVSEEPVVYYQDVSDENVGWFTRLRDAKSRVERAVNEKYGESSYGTWEEGGPGRWYLRRRSDGAYVARIDEDMTGRYSMHMGLDPMPTYDMASMWWGDSGDLEAAKSRLVVAAAEKMADDVRLRKEEDRFIWDPYERTEFTYGTRASDEATVVGVRRLDDVSFRPRIWIESYQSWSEGADELGSFDEAKEAAERMYRTYYRAG